MCFYRLSMYVMQLKKPIYIKTKPIQYKLNNKSETNSYIKY